MTFFSWSCSCQEESGPKVVDSQDYFGVQNIDYHFVSPGFKIICRIIVVLCLCSAHSIRCIFTNKVARRDPVKAIHRPSDYGSGDKDRPEFIRCVDRQHPEIHEVWTFREDCVTREGHPNARIDVGAFIGECFASNFLTPSWRRIPRFGSNYINESAKWLGITNFLRNDGTRWTLNFLAPYANWGT